MRLTPLDIRKQEFTRSFRGYEPEEVQAFLQMVSSQWEDLLDEQRHLEDRLRQMEAKLAHYEKVEEALQEALQTARESSRKALENAETRAKLIVQEAEARATEIKKDAEQERHQIKREAAKLSGRRNEIVARLRAFLMSEMELLARFEGDDPIGFIKLLPAEERRMQRLADRALPPREAESDDPYAPHESYGPPGARPPYAQDDEEEEDEQPFAPPPSPVHAAPEPAFEPATQDEPEDELDDNPDYEPDYQPGYEPDYQPGCDPDYEPEHEPDFEPSAARGDDEPRQPRVTWKHAPVPPEPEPEAPSPDEDEPEPAGQAPEPPAPRPVREEVKHGHGWTSRTVIAMPPAQPPPPRRDEEREGHVSGSDEEIEKIRRILNDLD